MDKLDKLPGIVKKRLFEFLSEIPVEKYSEQWRAIQVAIAMIMAPNSFKDNVHVYLSSREGAHEEGAFDSHTMSIKIWPHKLQMSRHKKEWTSWSGYRTNEHYYYTFPNGKHSVDEFERLISDTGELFYSNYSEVNHEIDQSSGYFANFNIETNV